MMVFQATPTNALFLLLSLNSNRNIYQENSFPPSLPRIAMILRMNLPSKINRFFLRYRETLLLIAALTLSGYSFITRLKLKNNFYGVIC